MALQTKQNELLLAISKGDLAAVMACIKNGVDVNARGLDGDSPLSLAVVIKHAGIIKALLDSGADPNAECNSGAGDYPLSMACVLGSAETMQLLIEAGADVNRQSLAKDKETKGTTPLMMACRGIVVGLVPQIKLLLNAGADPKALDEKKRNVLMHFLDSVPVRRMLGFSTGFAANVLGIGLKNPLEGKGRTDFADLAGNIASALSNKLKSLSGCGDSNSEYAAFLALLEAGADFNAIDAKGKSVLDYANRANDKKLIEILTEAGARSSSNSDSQPEVEEDLYVEDYTGHPGEFYLQLDGEAELKAWLEPWPVVAGQEIKVNVLLTAGYDVEEDPSILKIMKKAKPEIQLISDGNASDWQRLKYVGPDEEKYWFQFETTIQPQIATFSIGFRINAQDLLSEDNLDGGIETWNIS